MTLSELWPQLRPLCRKLALLGWACSAAGMAAGLAVAVASGTRLSPVMSTLQLLAAVCLVVAVASFGAAAAVQARPAARHETGARNVRRAAGGEAPAAAQSFLLGSLVLLAGAVAFACAGLVLPGGPNAHSVAFCQVFLLGAAASGFTFLLFSKIAPPRGGN
ncbi:MAG: hypothetical protein V7635_2352 [Arthrobacter sp.]